MHVIITGGSSGIGLAIAELAIADGHNVSIIARDNDRLQSALKRLGSLPGGQARAVSADVTSADQIGAAMRQCEDHFGACDLLVAGAGIVEPAFFTELPPTMFRAQFETNFFGVVNSVHAVLPAMQQRGRGSLMIVSSCAALIGLPGYTAYCASKAALASFAESLRCEVGQKLQVAICFPPDTRTPQFFAELSKRPEAARSIMGKSAVWPVETVAKEIYSAAKTGRTSVHFGWQLKALALFGPFLKPLIYKLLSKNVEKGIEV